MPQHARRQQRRAQHGHERGRPGDSPLSCGAQRDDERGLRAGQGGCDGEDEGEDFEGGIGLCGARARV